MKYFTPLLIMAILFASCNGKDNNKTVVLTDSSAIEKQWKDAISAHPDSLLLKENLIQYYRDNGEYDLAIAFTDDVIKKDSNNARLWKIKATLHVEDEDTTNAIHALEKAMKINPDPEYIIDLGTLYAETKNAKALDIAHALLAEKKEKTVKEAYFIRGLYYNYSGDKTKAISNMDSCLALDYTYMLAYREKAIALYDLGKYEPALSVLDKALTLQNNFDEGYYWRGRCLEKLKRTGDAIEAYKTALLYSPEYIEAQQALSRLEGKDN